MAKQKILTSCPTCQKKDTWQADNKSRPFCSERCKLIDLGTWAGEENKIPGESVPLDSDEE